jgi:hypothetical protein
MTAIPSAPAGARVMSAGSWYRQENSNTSDTNVTDTAEAKNSRQARASWRVPGSARRRSRAAEPASPVSVNTTSSGPGV